MSYKDMSIQDMAEAYMKGEIAKEEAKAMAAATVAKEEADNVAHQKELDDARANIRQFIK